MTLRATWLLGVLAILGVAGAAHAEAVVTLRAESALAGPTIHLSDVFEGVVPADDTEIAIAPAPGKSVTYEVRVLSQLAQQYNLAWRPQSVADRVVLTRTATHITPDMIRSAVLSKVRQINAADVEHADVQFDLRLTGLALPSDIAPTFDLSGFDYDVQTHRFRAELMTTGGGQPVTQNVSGRVVVRKEVPVLTRPLSAGTVVGASDLKWMTLNDERIGDDVLTSADLIVGHELRRNQNEGDPLRARDVQSPRLVQRGGIVTLKVETPLMLVTAQGRALQDGAKGDTVRVTNTQSNRTVEGIVEATGVVRVGGPRVVALAR